MNEQETLILEGARELWPHPFPIEQPGLRKVAEDLARQKLLKRSKFSGSASAYIVTAAGRTALENGEKARTRFSNATISTFKE